MTIFAIGLLLCAALAAAVPLVARRAPLRAGRLHLALTASENKRVSWACPKLGALGCLEQQEEAMPNALADNECVVGVRAIGLNYADIFCVLGLYEAANKMLAEGGEGHTTGLVPGLEFSGVVLATGRGVTQHAVGDRVYGFCRFGAYRTKVVAPAFLLKPIPDGWTYAEGTSVMAQGLTAWTGLVTMGRARKGSRVLVHSAAGGVGCATLQICEALGCEAVGVVGDPSKVAFLKERYPTCTPLVRAPERQYAKQLTELGRDYDVIMDSLGGRYLTGALDRLAPFGHLVHFGATHAYGGSPVDGLFKWLKLVPSYLRRPMVDPGKLVPANRAVVGLQMIWLTERVDELTEALDEMLTRGGLAARPPAVGRTFDFAELPAALDYLRSGQSVGKVVVTVEPADE